jgi:hypothetical protein
MTKLEELKAVYDAAEATYNAIWDVYINAANADKAALAAAEADAYADYASAYADYAPAYAAYKAELEKQQTTPREPVEDEGNPLV